MKRFAAIFMVLALVFAVVPSTVFAETNADPAQPAPTAPVKEEAEKATSNTNQTDGTQAPENNEQTNNNDQQSGGNQSGDNQSGDNKSDNGGAQTGDNKNQTGDNNNQSGNNNPPQQEQPCSDVPSDEDIHDINVDIQDTGNGKVKVTAKLDGKEAKGNWLILAGSDAAGKKLEKEFNDVNGTSITYEFDINDWATGEYDVYVLFEGTIDGNKCAVGYGEAGLSVEDDTVKPAPDKHKPTPEKEKEAVKEIKGGKLPKTATTYPVSMAFGGLLLAAGVGMLMFRRLSA
jgi:LPXTG-motif cell wall-anchored protein